MKRSIGTLRSFFSMLLLAMTMFAFTNCANTGRGLEKDAEENADEIEDAADEVEDDLDK